MYKYSLDQLRNLAESTALSVEPPYSILLEGDLGAGKTTFSQFFISKLLKDKTQPVTSPTFNIVQVYDTVKGDIWHVDLYRINHEDELPALGIFEALHECICLIEWPQILRKYITDVQFMTIALA